MNLELDSTVRPEIVADEDVTPRLDVEDLALRAQQGDMDAMGKLYSELWPSVYGAALRFTGNPERAADQAQDTFVRVLGKINTYQPGNFMGWLYRVNQNMFRDNYRHGQRLLMDPLPEDIERSPDFVASDDPEAAAIARVDDPAGQLLALVDNPDFRQTLWDTVVLCIPAQEIGDERGITRFTVGSQKSRGLHQIRHRLGLNPDGSTTDSSRAVL